MTDVTDLTDAEWVRIEQSLVRGGLRGCINDIIAKRCEPPVTLNERNRRIIDEAYDPGDGTTLTLVHTEDPPWFAGMWEDQEVMMGLEHEGTLFSIVYASGGGLVAVVVGQGLVTNEVGRVFNNVSEAKAYVEGLTAK